MADPDEALIEAIAEELRIADDAALVETNFDQLSATYDDAARAAYAAMVAHLGLVEERAREMGPGVNRPMRRFVSRWVEVDHGSE